MRIVVALPLIALSFCGGNANAGDIGLEAQWLWNSHYPRANETVRFRREFIVNGPKIRSTLRGLADDRAKVFLDGRLITEVTSAKRFTQIEQVPLKQGKNLIEVEAHNRGGAGGVWLQLDWTDTGGQARRLVTEGDWEACGADGNWRPATGLGLLGIAPWWRPAGEHNDYDQWKRAIGSGKADDAARMRVASGFQVELVRSAKPGEGSWVSLTFDKVGRLFIGREGPGILRMTLPKIGQTAPVPDIKVELINDKLEECRGLLWAFDSLYANANNSKGLYRLRDTKGDDKFDEVKLLRATGGGVGHGRNGLTLGPDNLIYVIHGNNTLVSEKDRMIPDKSPLRNIAEDRLRPAFWDRFLFDYDARVPSGYVARTDAEGTMWQVFAGGFRNPYGLDFNAAGDLFTFDADNEGDQGTPWYRPNRINHITSGGDFGFRQGSANRPGHYAEHLPGILNMGLASPTGVRSGHRGSFPAPYKEAMFVCDWSYGRIHAIHLDPFKSASYRSRAELFLEGQPLNVTDLTFGPDGAMYFTTGGRGTQSGLYRVRWVGKGPVPAPAPVPVPSALDQSNPMRRRQLERWHTMVGPTALEEIWPFLGNEDVWIRHAARVGLERQPVELWRERALKSPTTPEAARITISALLALARVAAEPSLLWPIVERINALPLDKLTLEDRLDAWRVYSVAFTRLGKPDAKVAKAVTEILMKQYPNDLEEPNQRLGELLAFLEWPSLVQKTIPRLEQAIEQEDKLAYLTLLSSVRVGWTLDLKKRYFFELGKTDHFDGGNLLPIAINGIREEALAGLSDLKRRELGSLLEPAEEREGDGAAAGPARPIVREWKLEDLELAVKNQNIPRDVKRGEKLFTEALCIRCHRVGTEGRTFGPDLTFVAARFGPRDLLEHTLLPSKVIEGKYRQTIVETKSGRLFTGRTIGGDAGNLLLASDPFRPTKVTKVPLKEIETRKDSPVSSMPVGLLNSLTQTEILDLLEYLRAGKR